MPCHRTRYDDRHSAVYLDLSAERAWFARAGGYYRGPDRTSWPGQKHPETPLTCYVYVFGGTEVDFGSLRSSAPLGSGGRIGGLEVAESGSQESSDDPPVL